MLEGGQSVVEQSIATKIDPLRVESNRWASRGLRSARLIL